jgi:hypothetical protein
VSGTGGRSSAPDEPQRRWGMTQDRSRRTIAVVLRLYPAAADLVGGENPYALGLDSFHAEIRQLAHHCVEAGVRADAKGRSAAKGHAPAVIGEILLWLSAAGGGAAVAQGAYKLLKLWADVRKGRKFRVMLPDFEIEATQMSERKFVQMIEKLLQAQRGPSRTQAQRRVVPALKAEGIPMLSAGSALEEANEIRAHFLGERERAMRKSTPRARPAEPNKPDRKKRIRRLSAE